MGLDWSCFNIVTNGGEFKISRVVVVWEISGIVADKPIIIRGVKISRGGGGGGEGKGGFFFFEK